MSETPTTRKASRSYGQGHEDPVAGGSSKTGIRVESRRGSDMFSEPEDGELIDASSDDDGPPRQRFKREQRSSSSEYEATNRRGPSSAVSYEMNQEPPRSSWRRYYELTRRSESRNRQSVAGSPRGRAMTRNEPDESPSRHQREPRNRQRYTSGPGDRAVNTNRSDESPTRRRREPRSRRRSSGGSGERAVNTNRPGATSTGVRPQSQHTREPNPVMGFSTRNLSQLDNSQMGTPKMFKVEPYPKAVKPTEQLQEWNYWLANFEMASERAGIMGQRLRAVELSLHIGEEMRRTIIGKDMLPRVESVAPDFNFYDNVVAKLEEHFRSLTDESVDVTAFNQLKQKEDESAIAFEFRLMQMAKRMNETNSAMIRTRYIEGLRDKELRDRAYVDGISLANVVKMATRKEAIASAQAPDGFPWAQSSGDNRQQLAVAAVSGTGNWGRAPSSGDRSGRGRFRDRRQQGDSRSRAPYDGRPDDGRWQRDKEEPCKACGARQHHGEGCRAKERKCFGCGDIGHFKHMCTKGLRSIAQPDTSEVRDKIYK